MTWKSSELGRVVWPDYELVSDQCGAVWRISQISPDRETAAEIASLCSREAAFLKGRCALSWLVDEVKILEKTHDRDLSLFGFWSDDELVGVILLKAHQLDLVIEYAFVCLRSDFKTHEATCCTVRFALEVMRRSGAHLLYADCVTHIIGAQNAVEACGLRPIGVQLGFEIFGGKGDECSRATTIRYAKFLAEVESRVLDVSRLRLTPQASSLVALVTEAFVEKETDDGGDVVFFPLKEAG